MKLKSVTLVTLGIIAVAAGTLYLNRINVLRYSLGWYTDVKHPRESYRPVQWMDGPAQTVGTTPRLPNVIIILADDLGINDVSTNGGGYTKLGAATPNIDSIARDGVNFIEGYSGAAVCTVSRAALMTGRYPWRFGVEFTPLPGAMARVVAKLNTEADQLHPTLLNSERIREMKDFDDLGMPASEVTVAEILKQRGYHNIHIGKWHLGSTKDMRPNNQGFDESLFMESGLYLPQDSADVVNSKQDFDPIDKFLWPNMRFGVSYNGGKWFEPNKYLTDYFTDEAVTAIKKNKNRPFFMYLAHWGVHTPLQASKADYDALSGIKDHRQRVYAAMVRSVDRSVGRILQTLREQGLDENTLVIFSSDNGAPGYLGLPEVNRPYRGWKLTHFQGGLRVPYMAKWPGHITPGQRYAQAISNIDMLPTIAAATGAALPSTRTVDGVNLLPFLGGQPATQAQRSLYWRDGDYRAVLHQGWKLISSELPKKDWLFNLQADPTEKVNLATLQPEKLRELKLMLQNHHASMPASLWPSLVAAPIYIDKTLDQARDKNDEYTYWAN
ncbi:MAG: sulfatase-like hydrolase/transferase [Undibacterium umbellatum]|uniref:sulfatase-like hydrolase/transferase n=1 Tax=Undibacterium umbellatum TaxID=2762300 RepID=UPI003BB72928